MPASKAKKNRILTGIQPSGDMQLGNYLGAVKNWAKNQDIQTNFIPVVDLHTITVKQDPQELKKWVSSIRTAYTMLGTSEVKPTENEEKMKVLARRSIIALDDIEKDEVFTDKNIGARRPGNGLPPTMIESIIGLKAKQKIPKCKLINQNDFGENNENI